MLFVVGGSGKFPVENGIKKNYNASALKTTEFVTAEKSWRGPDLPIPISDACFVKINESMALLLGGISTDGKFPEETFYYDIQERSWIPGKFKTFRYLVPICKFKYLKTVWKRMFLYK